MLNDSHKLKPTVSVGEYTNRRLFLLIFVGCQLLPAFFLPTIVYGHDWPMWRYDAGRRAASPEELPAQMHLQWVRELARPRPAWPASQDRLQFDASYEPVVGGKTIFVGSMVSDRVTAYDTETGKEKWRFYTDGPVRFAPVVYKDKLYFTSDDGFLYCLNAKNGSLVRKFLGGPARNKVLGNDRLIGMWPMRGGPVLYEGKIYFAAGIWPFMGTFINAIDAE
ncbi:MAG: outer membrane protein assembly factor BamB family protein, partial [Planctomycetota bacterium]